MFIKADEYQNGQPFRKQVDLTVTREESGWEVVPVQVIKETTMIDPDYPDDGPQQAWQVRIPVTGKMVTVMSDDLTPAPDAPEHIGEKLARLAGSFHSPLVAAFAVEAIHKYADVVVADEEKTKADMANHFITGEAWIDAAKVAKRIVNC